MRYKQTLREEYFKDIRRSWKNMISLVVIGSIIIANCMLMVAAIEMMTIVHFNLNPGLVITYITLAIVALFIIAAVVSHIVLWTDAVKARTKERIDTENKEIMTALAGDKTSTACGCGSETCL